MANQKSNSGNKSNFPDFHPKRSLGQCFLTNTAIARKIAEFSGADKATTVIEVGPGTGAITGPLLEVSGHVIAYEIDRDVIPILIKNTGSNPNLEIKEMDILKADLSFIDTIKENVIAVSNLPYYITSPIIDIFLTKTPKIKRMVFMVQKEMADRITAKVGTKDYNAFSVEVQYAADVSLLLKVPRTSFNPEPNVDSAVISLEKKERKNKPNNESFFYTIVETSFRERRKTILNNLSFGIPKDEVRNCLEETGIDPSRRAETLTIDEFINISNLFGGKK